MCDAKAETAPCRDVFIIDQIAICIEQLLEEDEDES
jgi:hypothetical protein